jgi:predicted RNA-binding protein associated with RNAse of E/G family
MMVVCDEGAPWTIWLFFAEVGAFDSWYVNFESYLGRSAVAYDSVDHKLDLIVRPDGIVEWKDEDELEQAAALGLLDADAVRDGAARALAKRPWPTGWEAFRPGPSWPVPELPEGWDVR